MTTNNKTSKVPTKAKGDSNFKLHPGHFLLLIGQPPTDFNAQKDADSGLSNYDLIYKYHHNVAEWFRLQCPNGQMGENVFLLTFRKLTNFKEHELLDVFDAFDKADRGYLTFDQFFLIFALIAARESGRLTQCLQMNGKKLFEALLQDSEEALSFERFARLAIILSVPEHVLFQRLREQGLTGLYDMVRFEDFMQYYFVIMDEFDKGAFDAKTHQQGLANAAAAANAHPDVEDKAQEKCIIS